MSKAKFFSGVAILALAAIAVTGCGKSGDGKDAAAAADAITVTDSRDGKTYRAVKIGKQTWMAENLNYQTEKSVCNSNDSSNCRYFGRLYDWNTAKSVCPAGWHLPSDAEWTALTKSAGGDKVAGKRLKSKSGWNNRKNGGSGNGTDSYGFSALPGGYRWNDRFNPPDDEAYWWTSTEYDEYKTWVRGMDHGKDNVLSSYGNDTFLNSVRCVKDE